MTSGDPRLPTGTVTFLFTDIEKSTKLIQSVGDDRYADLLEAHRGLLRSAFRTHNGVESATGGDAFFVVFSDAADAVRAAVAGQKALAGHPWRGGDRLRVRMGIHTGHAIVRSGEYVGYAVHRAHRVSEVAHGGQILLSETTAALTRGDVALRDLGWHRLKDLGAPERIYQVAAPGLDDDFPELRSLESVANNLPANLKHFIDRDEDAAEVVKRLEANRLVTITGAGGSGKTRLALHVAAALLDAFLDGVWLVDLAPITDPDVVPRQVAQALGLREDAAGMRGAVPAVQEQTIVDRLIDALMGRRILLIFDNTEHLLDACSQLVAELLRACAQLTVLATSREPLGVEGEAVWRIPSMDWTKRQARTRPSVYSATARPWRRRTSP